jgi:CheY-like chemotaxis protein
LKILAIDDQQLVLLPLQKRCEELGYDVVIETDAFKAIAHYNSFQPDLVIVDINMPKINGLEVLKKIKSHPDFKIIPVVILTTSSESSDIQTAYQMGANSYIVKPVDFEKFIDVASQIELYWRVLNKPI